MRQNKLQKWFCMICCLMASVTALADEGYSFTLSLSSRELSLDYYPADSDPSKEKLQILASMTSGMKITPTILLRTPYQFEAGTRAGYYFESSIARFSMTLQNVETADGIEERDLGTQVKGDYWYITPVVFGLYGPLPQGQPEWSHIIGLGVGIGYLNAKGSMQITGDGTNRLLTVDESGFDIAVTLLYEVHYKNWMLRVFDGGPALTRGLFSYSINEFSMDLGYVVRF